MEKRADLLINNNSMREKVRDELHRRIVNQELKPGERLVETRLAAQMGTSKAPIREAIRELEVMGLVETVTYKGSFVRKLTPLDLAHVSIARGSLEAAAAESMAKEVTDGQLKELGEMHDALNAAAMRQDEAEYFRIDMEFHRSIVLWCSNQVLYRLWNMLNVEQWARLTSEFTHKELKDYAGMHTNIFNAIKERDGERASYELHKHFNKVYIESMREYEKYQDSEND